MMGCGYQGFKYENKVKKIMYSPDSDKARSGFGAYFFTLFTKSKNHFGFSIYQKIKQIPFTSVK